MYRHRLSVFLLHSHNHGNRTEISDGKKKKISFHVTRTKGDCDRIYSDEDETVETEDSQMYPKNLGYTFFKEISVLL